MTAHIHPQQKNRPIFRVVFFSIRCAEILPDMTTILQLIMGPILNSVLFYRNGKLFFCRYS